MMATCIYYMLMFTWTFSLNKAIYLSTFTVVNDFRWFLGQFPTNYTEILRALFSSDVVTTLKISLKNFVNFKS